MKSALTEEEFCGFISFALNTINLIFDFNGVYIYFFLLWRIVHCLGLNSSGARKLYSIFLFAYCEYAKEGDMSLKVFFHFLLTSLLMEEIITENINPLFIHVIRDLFIRRVVRFAYLL